MFTPSIPEGPFYYEATLPDGRVIKRNELSAAVIDRVTERLGWFGYGPDSNRTPGRSRPASEHLMRFAEYGDFTPCGFKAPDGTDVMVGVAKL